MQYFNMSNILKYTSEDKLFEFILAESKHFVIPEGESNLLDDMSDFIRQKYNSLLNFMTENVLDFHQESQFDLIISKFGFDRILAKEPQLRLALWCVVLKNLVKYNKLDDSFLDKEFPKTALVEAGSSIETASSYSATGNAAIASSSTASTYARNHQVEPTFKHLYVTGNIEIDHYIRYSIIYYFNSSKFSTMTKMRKLIMIQLNQYLCKISNHILMLNKKQDSTRFRKDGQNVLSAYLENFARFHLRELERCKKYKVIPYLCELNGVAGVGKSTLVDFLSEFLQQVFPFYNQFDMKYNRVNDKFWNGYKQQPIVVYDDQNQNRDLLYSLDNEIIALGSGQLVHPPMAFEKDARFSSIFVVFTTNKKLIDTTQADKGAVARRIHTFECVPKEGLGCYSNSEFGKFWMYDEDVLPSPFNVELNNLHVLHLIFDFLKFQMKQTFLQDREFDVFWFLKPKESVKKMDLSDLLGCVPREPRHYSVKSRVLNELGGIIARKKDCRISEMSVKFDNEFQILAEGVSIEVSELSGMKPTRGFLSGLTGLRHGFGANNIVETTFPEFWNAMDHKRVVTTDWHISSRLNQSLRVISEKRGSFHSVYVLENASRVIKYIWIYDLVSHNIWTARADLKIRSLVKEYLVSLNRRILQSISVKQNDLIYDVTIDTSHLMGGLVEAVCHGFGTAEPVLSSDLI